MYISDVGTILTVKNRTFFVSNITSQMKPVKECKFVRKLAGPGFVTPFSLFLCISYEYLLLYTVAL